MTTVWLDKAAGLALLYDRAGAIFDAPLSGWTLAEQMDEALEHLTEGCPWREQMLAEGFAGRLVEAFQEVGGLRAEAGLLGTSLSLVMERDTTAAGAPIMLQLALSTGLGAPTVMRWMAGSPNDRWAALTREFLGYRRAAEYRDALLKLAGGATGERRTILHSVLSGE